MKLNQLFKDKPMGTQFYLAVKGQDVPVAASNVMQLGQYVNPELAHHSTYFKSLDAMMKCVERNAGVTDPAAQEKVCASEFRNLRLEAFNNNLFY